MEALSLLRYWRNNAGDAATTNADATTSTATTIVTSLSTQTSEIEDEDNDHGPFFDLEFTLPAEGDEDELVKNGETENNIDYGEENEEDDSDGSDETELKFTLYSGSSSDGTADVNVSVSPSDDLFFNGGFVPVEQTEEINSKSLQSRVSLIKSATKLRVMMLKLKKSKSNASNSKEEQKKEEKTEKSDVSEDSGKSAAVKQKAEDVIVPIVSLFKRRNSSKAPKKKQNENENNSNNESVSANLEEKKFTKEAMQRYLRKMKPLYVRVSQKYVEKLKFTGNLSSLTLPRTTKLNTVLSPETEEQKQSPVANPRREKESSSEVAEPPLLMSSSNIKLLKQGNLPAGLRVVCKHLRKSRSGFTAVAAAPPGAISSNRRDDSLLQQQDGIQSAILHCKSSFKASRDSDCSASDPAETYGKSENSLCSDAAEGEETEEMKKR
ncbi:hypothetical protein QVD17_01938 [Tagetes erecta]|uniref:Membrane-associated kinase regulator 2 n=1 Tax=Tagetes erecta TaxID=13708 RepID=A0AAD8L7A2_TARER|nr:hypothetical protein QVD17_01938 [Tagetes erecta]